MKKVLAYGEILWDIIEGVSHIGGAPLNYAAHVRKCGVQSAIISCLGNDKLGVDAFEKVSKWGVDTSFIQRRNKKTGIVNVHLVNGQPDYTIVKKVAYDYINLGEIDLTRLQEFDLFYFGTLIQRSDSSRETLYEILRRTSFKEVFYDINLRKDSYQFDQIEYALNFASIFKINDEEVKLMSQHWGLNTADNPLFCQHLFTRYPKLTIIIVTAGGKGCYVCQRTEREVVHIPSDPVHVADTVGAGDSFSAAFTAKYLMGLDPISSAKIANKVGGYVASCQGAIPDYSDEINELLEVF